jgi:quinol monooxygenase YgiN
MRTTALCYHRVADYDAWKQGYDQALASPMSDDLRSYRIWRGQDDPNLVLVEETFDSREVAEAGFTSEEVRDAMASAGVDMASLQIEYVDEVESGTR